MVLARGRSSVTAKWAAQTAAYEVETHGARKIFSLLDAEFKRSGSCVPQAQHKVLLATPSLEVWDGARKIGPAISSTAQAHAVEMAKANGMGAVMVRDCNHFGWGPAYALNHLSEDLVVGNITQGAIPIVTPIGGTEPTLGSNAIALAIHTGSEECPFFLWDTGTAAMSWGEVEKLRAEEALGSRNSRGEAPGTLPLVHQTFHPMLQRYRGGGGLASSPFRRFRRGEGCLETHARGAVGMHVQGGAVDSEGKPAVKASDAAFLLPAGTIGNALGIIIELLSASLGAGDPRLRSEPPEKVPDGEPVRLVERASVTRVEGKEGTLLLPGLAAAYRLGVVARVACPNP